LDVGSVEDYKKLREYEKETFEKMVNQVWELRIFIIKLVPPPTPRTIRSNGKSEEKK
jgi:hypothetical protein